MKHLLAITASLCPEGETFVADCMFAPKFMYACLPECQKRSGPDYLPDCCTGEEEGLRVIVREGELMIGMCLDEDGRSSSCLIDELGLNTLC